MSGLPNLVLFVCVLSAAAAIISCETTVQRIEANSNSSSCPSYQTECKFGCCPYANAHCCYDGLECCQHGQTCVGIPFFMYCVGAEDSKNEVTPLILNRATPIKSFRAITANSNSSSCPSYQTECQFGCCPYADAECCYDGLECCQHGQTCAGIPFFMFCVGAEDSNNEVTPLISNSTTSVKRLVTDCPPDTTTCGYDKCCRFENATCCSDGEHCCPSGYKCDRLHKLCKRNSFNYLKYMWSLKKNRGASLVTPKASYKSCPGSSRVCPSHTSCCLEDTGNWNCCLYPSSSFKKPSV